METYHVIGLMSGTSLDGVDVAYCILKHDDGKWNFEINKAETIPYDADWKRKLETLPAKSALEFVSTDAEYGRYLGELTKTFINKFKVKVDFISSHGHTIFHQPEKGITVQIGNGAALCAASGVSVICDFRSLDVALGGQGAPLVPIGDRLLFSDYTYCVNLGGIANISFEQSSQRIAFDICPANMILNELSQEESLPYDKDGVLSGKGNVNEMLLEELNALRYYSLPHPKSLGREWVEKEFFPILKKHSLSTVDKLNTCCEHIAIQIAKATGANAGNMLITGGGAFNKFLIERIASHFSGKIILPDATIINYKEALIFAFLGVLRMRGEINCLKSVTGATKDSCCGTIYLC